MRIVIEGNNMTNLACQEMFSKSGGKYDAFNTPDAKSKVGEKVPRKEHEEVLKPQSKLTDDGRSEEKKRDTEKVMSVQDRLKQYKERGVASSKPPSAPEERGLKTLDKKKESKRESSGSDIGSEAKSETKANGTRTGEVERLSGELAQEKANSERLQAIVETLQLENSALKEKVSTLEAGLQEERAKIVAADEWCEKFKKELEMLDLPAAGQ